MPAPGVGCRLCPGLPPAPLVLVGASEREGKGQDLGLGAVLLASTCTPVPGGQQVWRAG